MAKADDGRDAANALYALLQAAVTAQTNSNSSSNAVEDPSLRDNASSSGGSVYHGDFGGATSSNGGLMTPRPEPDLLNALQAFAGGSGSLAHSHTMALLSNTPGLPDLLPGLTIAPPSPASRLMPAPPVPHHRPSSKSYTPVPTRSGRVPQLPDPKDTDRDTVLFNDYFDWPSSDEDDEDFDPSGEMFDTYEARPGDIVVGGSGTEGMTGGEEGETDFSLLDEGYMESLQKTFGQTTGSTSMGGSGDYYSHLASTAGSNSYSSAFPLDPTLSVPIPTLDPSLFADPNSTSTTSKTSKIGKSRSPKPSKASKVPKVPKASTSTTSEKTSRTSRKRSRSSTSPTPPSPPNQPPVVDAPPSPATLALMEAAERAITARGRHSGPKRIYTPEEALQIRRKRNAKIAKKSRSAKKAQAEYNEHRVAELEDENLELREKVGVYERVLRELPGGWKRALEALEEEENGEEDVGEGEGTSPRYPSEGEDDEDEDEGEEDEEAEDEAEAETVKSKGRKEVKNPVVNEVVQNLAAQGFGELEKLLSWTAQVNKAKKSLK